MELFIAVGVLFGLMILGMPLFICFGSSALVAIFLLDMGFGQVTSKAFGVLDSFPIMAIPFFVLAGDLMAKGGLASKLIDLAYAVLGRVRGGLGFVIILSSMFFGALSGSATATSAAIGSVMIPRMEHYGYQRCYSSALAGASGWLGALIPPSMILIIYGVVANQSIAALFLSTVIPGIMLGFLFMVVNFWLSPRYMMTNVSAEEEHPSESGFTEYMKGIRQAFYRALPALTTPLIILGGIYGGAFTPTEAGAVACAWAIITGTLVYRSLPAREIIASLLEGAVLTASIFIILTFVAVFSRVLIVNYVPQTLLDFMLSLSTKKYVILLLINMLVLISGMFIEGITIVLVLCPLLLPIVKAFHVDLIHFGAILCLNIGIGTITPPMAINIFVASSVGEVSIQEITKPILVFLLLGSLPVLILTTYIPSLALWLPRLIMK